MMRVAATPTYVEEGLFAGAPHGWAGAPERLINCLSYFTELSNIMVAIISTVLARRGRVGAWGRATHLCALMMITVTAIVYATLIGPYEVLSGFALVTNPLPVSYTHLADPVELVDRREELLSARVNEFFELMMAWDYVAFAPVELT